VYTPLVQKDEYLDHESSSFLKRFYNGSLSTMLANFIEKDQLSDREIENLQELLAQRSNHEK
ncbi:MAG: BlaI/MecI/CopY family transcriptional regulator, partial [Roseburia sp.]|nr:BlaI/MecI/CopY family transcriptional regulator [Roseburia sp.]